MKRSEMVKRIAWWLDRSKTTVLMNGNEGKAESLLKQLEVWGMLPPLPEKQFRREGDKLVYQKHHKWEPEID